MEFHSTVRTMGALIVDPINIFTVFFFETIGELGFHYFDVHRNAIFGFTSILTIISTALFLYGVSAFSTSEVIVESCNWAKLSTYNATSNTRYSLKFGLNAMVINSCNGTTIDNFSKCQGQLLKYNDPQCSKEGFIGDFCTFCGNAASAEATGAAFTAVSKLFSLLGMQRRMYTSADSPSFKMLAILLEIVGAISLLVSLMEFEYACVLRGINNLTDPSKIYSSQLSDSAVNAGSAFGAYAFGVVAALIRLIVHILVPLPHRGKGICAPIMKLFTKCDGCCVLYEDEKEELKRIKTDGIQIVQ